MSLKTNHSGLNKFGSSKDENFLMVWPEIERMVRMAPQRIEESYRCGSPVLPGVYIFCCFSDLWLAQILSTETQVFRVDFSLEGFPLTKGFVARDAEMTQLTDVLLTASTDKMSRKVFVLHGLGGIGKTQLAVEFTRKYHNSYSAVFWLDGSTKEQLVQSFANLVRRLPQDQLSKESQAYSESGAAKVDSVVKDVLRWLSRPLNNNWLLVFDNVDRDFSDSSEEPQASNVKEYFPTAHQGSILVTSRLENLSRLGPDMKLGPVDEKQRKQIIERIAGRSIDGK